MMNNEELRLQKFLARCGIASRRASEKLILNGEISINGKIVTKMGTKINPDVDIVTYDGKIIKPKITKITIMLNKPAGYISTMNDPQNRPCVANLVPSKQYPSLFPVGRLDRLTQGLLIFSTDGQLGQNLLHPKNEIKKNYEVVIDGKLTPAMEEFKKLCTGVKILSGVTAPANIEILEHFKFDKYLAYEEKFFQGCAKLDDSKAMPKTKDLINNDFTKLNIQIHEGKNRQVRRMFEAVGFNVLLLTRKSIGKLKLDNLECGKWRKLKDEEIDLMLN